MAAYLLAPLRHMPSAAPWHRALSALGTAWTAHTLRRAIAGVSSASDHTYRDFGLDKADIVTALSRVLDHIRR